MNNVLYIAEQDFSQDSVGFQKAVFYSQARGAKLSVLKVIPEITELSHATTPEMFTRVKKRMVDGATQELTSKLAECTLATSVSIEIASGKEFFEAIRCVVEKGFDLVIKQAESPSWLDALFGSNDLHLIRKCPCPVWLIAESEPAKYHHVFAAIDFSDDDIEIELNNTIMQHALTMSAINSAKPHLLSVYDSSLAGFASMWADNPDKMESTYLEEEYTRRQYSARALIEASLAKIEQGTFTAHSVTKHIVEGKPEHAIPRIVKNTGGDLLIMGTVGRAGITGMLIGNTAETILLQVKCSVLAIKPSGFVCPLKFD